MHSAVLQSVYASVCLSTRLSQYGILTKWLNLYFLETVALMHSSDAHAASVLTSGMVKSCSRKIKYHLHKTHFS